ncbi:MAG: AAA family ATPase [Frankia sp.]
MIAVEGIDGAGKSSLAERLVELLGGSEINHLTRLSPHSGALLREMVKGDGDTVRYQDVVPPGLRRAIYTVDALVQFRYLADRYGSCRNVVFDRWLQTYEAYCGPFDTHERWYELLEARIPRPTVLFHLRVDPRTALERLARRGDWTARNWSADRLLDDLRRLAARYDEMMAGTDHVVLDGNEDAEVVVRQALAVLRQGPEPVAAGAAGPAGGYAR